MPLGGWVLTQARVSAHVDDVQVDVQIARREGGRAATGRIREHGNHVLGRRGGADRGGAERTDEGTGSQDRLRGHEGVRAGRGANHHRHRRRAGKSRLDVDLTVVCGDCYKELAPFETDLFFFHISSSIMLV